MKNTRPLIIVAVIVGILMIPLIAMQFTNEVDWDARDFIIMGALLLITGLAIEVALRKFRSVQSRLIACGVILALLFLTWAELAVGIFGSPFAGS